MIPFQQCWLRASWVPWSPRALFVWSLGICLEHKVGGTRLVFAGGMGLGSGRGKGVCSPQTFGRLSPGLVDGQGSFSMLWGHSQGSGLGRRRKCRLAVSRPEMPEQMGWDGGMEGSEQCSLALIQLACASSPMVSHPPQDIVAKANAK